ncbi:autotransporter assembly complex family protein [Algiphilus sp.]|uniref:autotransporter assembly complex protein TamA n=1 Tax=Algiphilus sp. TaxID=1872431 RepID=UPI0032EC2EDD
MYLLRGLRLSLWGLCALGVAPGALAFDIEVRVEGVDGELRANVESLLTIRQAARQGESRPHVLQRLHKRAKEDIEQALQPFGYYAPVVRSTLDLDEGAATAEYRIEPGPRTRIRRVNIEVRGGGEDDPELQGALEKLPLRADQPLLHSDYRQAKERLIQIAFARGYFDVGYETAQIRVHRDDRYADIVLVLSTGPRYEVGEIRIDQDELDDAVIRRYLPIASGDPFSPDALLDTQFQLMELGYFSRVDVSPERDEAEEARMPIRIEPRYLPSQRYAAGIGFGTDTGARVSLESDFRHINRRGHSIESDIRVSQRGADVGGSYNIPLGSIPGESLSFSTRYEREEFEDGDSESYIIGASLARQPGDWKRRTYLEYSTERFSVGDLRRTTNLLVPGVSFERKEFDNEVFPRNGWSVFLDTHGAAEPALSSTTFAQSRVALRGILPLDAKSRLLGRFEYGASFVDSFDRLPLSERFYAGGDRSVRGYAFRSLGEFDDEGNVIGGEYLTTMSVEVDRLIWGNWGAAAFLDAGGAGNTAFPEVSRGVGLGLRYRSPVGAVRVDLAHPLDKDRLVRLHIGIGISL